MSGGYFDAALTLFRAARARELGCDDEAFDSHALAIVRKPETTKQPYVLLGMTFGTGTVLSVEESYREWVVANAPETHYRALFPNVVFEPLRLEALTRGEELAWRTPGLAFIPGAAPVAVPEITGFETRRVDREWRAGYWEAGEFDNALGTPGNEYVDSIWRFGTVIFDGDTPAAVAGAYDDGEGLLEVGVDVARAYRGRGLGEAVVRAQAWAIHQEGFVPTYYCAPTNVRSHRTALACGFVPVASGARVGRVVK